MWLNNGPLPAAICEREPELRRYGFYRRLDAGSFEFVSFCRTDAGAWVSVYGPDFYKILDSLLPAPTEQPHL